MRIEIEIPKEFEENFKRDQFEESLIRLNADAHETAGRYESETAIMLIKAFKHSKPAYDVDAVVRQLEEEKKRAFELCLATNDSAQRLKYIEKEQTIALAIEIVKGGGVNEC